MSSIEKCSNKEMSTWISYVQFARLGISRKQLKRMMELSHCTKVLRLSPAKKSGEKSIGAIIEKSSNHYRGNDSVGIDNKLANEVSGCLMLSHWLLLFSQQPQLLKMSEKKSHIEVSNGIIRPKSTLWLVIGVNKNLSLDSRKNKQKTF